MGIFHMLLPFLTVLLLRMVGGIEQTCMAIDDNCIDFNRLSGKELRAVMITVRFSSIFP